MERRELVKTSVCHVDEVGNVSCEEGLAVGYAWFFENAVIFGSAQDVISMKFGGRKNFGEFLGVVRGVVPQDKFQVLYERLKDTAGYKKREQERAVLERLGLSRRKMRILKAHGQQVL